MDDHAADGTDLSKKLRRWRKRHNSAAKVAEMHRQVLLKRVVESMAFENEPVTMARLRSLLEGRRPKAVK